MEKNEGKIDRIVRIVLGVILIVSAVFWVSGIIKIIFYIIGAILLITGALGFCCIYKVFNFSTIKKEQLQSQNLEEPKEKLQ